MYKKAIVVIGLVMLVFVIQAREIGMVMPVRAVANALDLPIEVVGQGGGSVNAVVAVGTYAYLGMGPRLVVVNISNPASMAYMGRSGVLAGTVEDIGIGGSYAYVVTDQGDLVVFDVSNPSSLVRLYTGSVCVRASAIEVSGTRAYVGCTSGEVLVVDISTPNSPTVVGQTTLPLTINDLAWFNGRLAVAAGSAGVAMVSFSGDTPNLRGTFNTSGTALGVYLAGDVLYVADFSNLVLLDVSDVDALSEIATKVIGAPGNASDVVVSGFTAYVTVGAGMRVYSLSALPTISEIGSYIAPNGANALANLCFFSGASGVLLATVDGGLQSVNVSTPSAPTQYGSYGAFGVVSEAALLNPTTVVTASGLLGLGVYDVGSNPANPSVIAQHDAVGNWFELATYGNTAYLGGTSSDLRVYDLTNIGLPVVTVLSGFTGIGDLWAGDGLLVVGDYGAAGDNLKIYDISVTPNAPVLVGMAPVPGGVDSVVVAGDRVYAVNQTDAYIYSITNPAAPTLLGIYGPYANTSLPDAALIGDVLAVSMDLNIVFIDVSNPASPQLIEDFVPGSCYIRSLARRGPLLVAGCSDSQTVLVHVPSPGAAAVAGLTLNGGQVGEQGLNGEVMYAAGLYDGLYILSVTLHQVFLPMLMR